MSENLTRAGIAPSYGTPDTSSNTALWASICVTLRTTASAACRRVRLTTTSSVYLAPAGGGSTSAPPSRTFLLPSASRRRISHGRTFPMNSSNRMESVPFPK